MAINNTLQAGLASPLRKPFATQNVGGLLGTNAISNPVTKTAQTSSFLAPPVRSSSPTPQNFSTPQNPPPATSEQPVKGLFPNVASSLPPAPTYSGLVGQLADQGGSQNNKIAQGSATALQGLGENNQGTSGPAYEAYQKAIADEQALKSGIAKSYGDIESQPIPLNFQQGREQVLARQNASLIDAAQNATSEKAAALGFGIQGNQAQQGAYGKAGDIALTGQGQTQSALSSAAGYAAPILGQPGQSNYGIGGNGGGQIQPNDPFYQTLQQYAGMLANNQGGAVPASVTGNPVLNAQLQQMAKQINPNYNYNTAQGAAAGEQAVAGAAGGATANVISTQTQQIEGYKSALQQGQNLQSQLSDLISTFGLNPNDLNAANSGIQKIAQNISSPQYQILKNYINDVANTYAQVLTPPGGAATDTTRSIATSMLDATASGKSIQSVMQSLDQAAQAKIAGVSTTQSNHSSSSGSSLFSW